MGAKSISRTWAGSGAAAIALLTIAQSQLGDLNLQTPVKWLLIFLLGVLVALITAYGSARSTRHTTQEEEAALQDALAGNLLSVSDRNPFDLGARPGPVDYVERPEDNQLAQALVADTNDNEAMVLLTGPPGAGKTRSAYEAILHKLPDAMLLVPVDGPAVSTLLAQRAKLGLHLPMQAVLWLDSLERYFEKLDLDALDELLFAPDATFASQGRVRRVWSRSWRALRRWSSTMKRPKDAFATKRATRRQVAVVATIRDDELKTALGGDDATAQTARRLTARMRTVSIAARPGAPAPVPPSAANVEPTAFEVPPAPTDGRNLVAFLGGLFIVLAVVLGLAVGSEGWTVPPSLTSQAENVENELATCQHASESPEAKELHKNAVWILAVSNKDCPGSDTVRYFVVSKKRLEEKFSESPESSERWDFACLAPGKRSACRTYVPGVGNVTLGAFRDAGKKLQIPLVLYQSGGEARLYSPFLSPPARRLGQGGGGQLMTLKLHRGAGYSPEPKAPRSACRRPAQLCSPAFEFLTALPQPEGRPLLIVGTVTQGTVTNPARISLRAFAVEYADTHVRVDPRECLFYRNGTRVSSKQQIEVRKPTDTAAEQVREYWTVQPAKEEAVVC